MNYVLKYQLLRLRCALIPSGEKRTKWIKKHNYFSYMGENCHFQPRKLPADPKFIKIHNNVSVASGVEFITHDIMHKVFNNLNDGNTYQSHLGCIEIMDNVFIGAGVKIMPNIRIGPNSIIAAGAIVTKDVPEGEVWGGIPAKKIGTFKEVQQKRCEESALVKEQDRTKRAQDEWENFYLIRNAFDI